MNSHPAHEVKINLEQLIDEVAISHEPIQITAKRNCAILIAKEDWHTIQKILHADSYQSE